jgi:hypothetical protein
MKKLLILLIGFIAVNSPLIFAQDTCRIYATILRNDGITPFSNAYVIVHSATQSGKIFLNTEKIYKTTLKGEVNFLVPRTIGNDTVYIQIEIRSELRAKGEKIFVAVPNAVSAQLASYITPTKIYSSSVLIPRLFIAIDTDSLQLQQTVSLSNQFILGQDSFGRVYLSLNPDSIIGSGGISLAILSDSLSHYATLINLSNYALSSHTHSKSNMTDFSESDYVHIAGSETILGSKNFTIPPKFSTGNYTRYSNEFFQFGNVSTMQYLNTANEQSCIFHTTGTTSNLKYSDMEYEIAFENDLYYMISIELSGIAVNASDSLTHYILYSETRLFFVHNDVVYEMSKFPNYLYTSSGLTFQMHWDIYSNIGLSFEYVCSENINAVAKVSIKSMSSQG